MADLTVTCFGSIDTDLARVAQQSIAVSSHAALIALNDVHFRLGMDDTGSGVLLASEPPTQRWPRLMEELFPAVSTARIVVVCPDANVECTARTVAEVWVSVVRPASAEHRSILARLLIATGTFLVAESVTLNEQVELAAAVHGDDASSVFDVDVIRENLDTAMAAGRKLLDHAAPEKLEDLFAGAPPVADRLGETVEAPYREEPSLAALDPSAGTGGFYTAGPMSTVALVADLMSISTLRRDTALIIDRTRSALRDKYLSSTGAQEQGLVVVVSTADGRQSQAIPLTPTFAQHRDAIASRRWLDHALDEITNLLLLLNDDVPVRYRDPMTRWERIAETFDLAVNALDADHIIVVSDAGSPVVDVDEIDQYQGAPSARTLVERLRADQLLPDLTGRSVTVINPTPEEADLSERWLALCSAANAVSCQIDLGHTTTPKTGATDTQVPTSPNATAGPVSHDETGRPAHRGARTYSDRRGRSRRVVDRRSHVLRRAAAIAQPHGPDTEVATQQPDNLVAYMIDEPRTRQKDILLVLSTAVTSIAVAAMAMFMLSGTTNRTNIALTALVAIGALLIPASGGFALASRSRREIPIVLHSPTPWDPGQSIKQNPPNDHAPDPFDSRTAAVAG